VVFFTVNSRRYFIAVLAAALCSQSASAYIDPGTGGAIVGSMVPVVGAFIAIVSAILLKYLINPIKKVSARVKDALSGKKEQHDEPKK
jgi:phosphate/sulfate permease